MDDRREVTQLPKRHVIDLADSVDGVADHYADWEVYDAVEVDEYLASIKQSFDTPDSIAEPVSNEAIDAERVSRKEHPAFIYGAQWMRVQLWPRIRWLLEDRNKQASGDKCADCSDPFPYGLQAVAVESGFVCRKCWGARNG